MRPSAWSVSIRPSTVLGPTYEQALAARLRKLQDAESGDLQERAELHEALIKVWSESVGGGRMAHPSAEVRDWNDGRSMPLALHVNTCPSHSSYF